MATTVLDCSPAVGIIDNRSSASRTNDFHSFIVFASGTWTVSMSYGNSCSGPWTSFGSQASLSNTSASPFIGWGEGNFMFIQFVITGNAKVNYSATKSMYYPGTTPNGGGGSAFVWLGPWSSVTAYAVNSVVSYSNSTYIAIAPSTSQTPNTSPSYWQLFVPGGAGTVTGVSCSTPGASWLTCTVTSPTTTPALAFTATSAQTPHQVIGTCGSATAFGACSLVAGDLPAIASLTNYPLTTLGDLFVGGASGAASRLAVGSADSVLQGGATPVWNSLVNCPSGPMAYSTSSHTWSCGSFSGSGINQLTGDGTAGPGSGSQVLTLATVNSSPGSCGDATHVCQVTVNGKGQVTSTAPITITGGGGGAGMTYQLGDLAVTVSGSVMTIGAGCAPSSPCNVRFNYQTYSITTSATATLGGTAIGSAYVYVTNSGTLTVGHNLTLVTCSAGCTVAPAVSAFPANSLPIWTWNSTTGSSNWDPAGGHDSRAFNSTQAYSAGPGVILTPASNAVTIGADLTVVPVYLTGSSSLTWGSASNGTCWTDQTFTLTGANTGDAVVAGWPSTLPTGVLGNVFVSASNTITVRLCNFSGSTISSISAATYRATILNP